MANAQPKPLTGFLLALLATMTWGSLPVAAQQALKAVDAPTLVWARFLSASLVLLAVLAVIGRLPRAGSFSKRPLQNSPKSPKFPPRHLGDFS